MSENSQGGAGSPWFAPPSTTCPRPSAGGISSSINDSPDVWAGPIGILPLASMAEHEAGLSCSIATRIHRFSANAPVAFALVAASGADLGLYPSKAKIRAARRHIFAVGIRLAQRDRANDEGPGRRRPTGREYRRGTTRASRRAIHHRAQSALGPPGSSGAGACGPISFGG